MTAQCNRLELDLQFQNLCVGDQEILLAVLLQTHLTSKKDPDSLAETKHEKKIEEIITLI